MILLRIKFWCRFLYFLYFGVKFTFQNLFYRFLLFENYRSNSRNQGFHESPESKSFLKIAIQLRWGIHKQISKWSESNFGWIGSVWNGRQKFLVNLSFFTYFPLWPEEKINKCCVFETDLFGRVKSSIQANILNFWTITNDYGIFTLLAPFFDQNLVWKFPMISKNMISEFLF